MQKIIYKKNSILGNNIIFLKEINKKRKNYRRALFKCFCNNLFECDLSQIKSLSIKSCGCLNSKENRRKRAIKHGLYNHILYKRWISINDRCYREKSSNFKNYGAKGIFVYEKWRNNFIEFYNYIIELENYNEKLLIENKISIDRIDNECGYMPGNLKFSSWHEQSLNQRKQSNNKSGYTGVDYILNLNKWKSSITINKQKIYLGIFKTKEEAYIKRQSYIKENNLIEYIKTQ